MIFEDDPVAQDESRGQLEKLRLQQELLSLRQDRALVLAWQRGITLDELSRLMRIPREEVAQRLDYAEDDTRNWVDGRLGGSPLEIVLMHAVGEITREQMINELADFPYVPNAPPITTLDDDLPEIIPGSWDQLASLRVRGHVSGSDFGEIIQRRAGRGRR